MEGDGRHVEELAPSLHKQMIVLEWTLPACETRRSVRNVAASPRRPFLICFGNAIFVGDSTTNSMCLG